MLFGYGLKQCQRQGVAFQLDRIRLHFGNVLLQKDAPSEAANRVVVDRGHLIFFTEEEPTVLPAAAPRGNTNITTKMLRRYNASANLTWRQNVRFWH